MASLPANVLIFGYTFFTLELFTYGIVFGIACLNLAVIVPTKLLHDNLKCILITQSVALIISVVVRSIMVVQKLLSNDPFEPAILCLQEIMFFFASFRRSLGHALIIERFIATVRANSYEQFSKSYFNIALFSITFAIAFVNTVTNGQSWTYTQLNFFTQSASTTISFVEFIFITVIWHYNRRRYISQIEKASCNNYGISQRYQVSDNMKTAKQLSPTFLCVFLLNLFKLVFYIIITSNMVNKGHETSLAFAFAIWIDIFFAAAIELTIMTHHPLLKRRLGILLKKIFCFRRNKIGEAQPIIVEKNGTEMADHFKMLEQAWNK